ncbi:cell division protein FtsQ/DivIB [uncultured Tessaracoccus sp.]|uniref:cell division protein FtsQ/DivIB n=1 Tax=uncultured Tessaracoccus sp. TaxID=905023 RepID=UPI00263A0D7E|nr:FtsQ-type POTRA domain-containing protein [uncultured Tessaracoccus sp.]
MSSPREFAKSLHDQRSKRRLRLWIGVGGGVFAVALTVFLVWLFLLSATFSADETVVEGEQLLTSDAVKEAAAVPNHVPLARLDTGAIRKRVEELPEVRSAEVKVDYPNVVRIQVSERVAVYQLAKGGAFSWVDAEGVEFRTGQARSKSLPEAKLARDDTRIRRDVATVATHIPEAAKKQVTLIRAKSVDRIEVSVADGRSIVWGSADESELKSEVLEALLSVDARIYDVSAPTHPTTK